MPEAFYIIPMVAGPYSITNQQRPMYVDTIRCNWTGHNVDDLGVYVCKVNTTEAKHTALTGMANVRQLPREYTWDTPLSDLKAQQRNAISNWCSNKGIPYDETETIGELLMRVINSGVLSLGNTALTTEYQNLTQTQKDKITTVCTRHRLAQPSSTETVRQISNRLGIVLWPGNDNTKVHVEEY